MQPSIHGTLIRIHDHGVLLRGAPGCGKSLCALQLLWQKHALVADDLILLSEENNQVIGQAPANGFGLLAVRALGVIDVAAVFSPKQLIKTQQIDLIIDFVAPVPNALPLTQAKIQHTQLGETQICVTQITISNSQDMAILVQTAVRLAFVSPSHRLNELLRESS
jgi:HPr kinase/phosphorylase